MIRRPTPFSVSDTATALRPPKIAYTAPTLPMATIVVAQLLEAERERAGLSAELETERACEPLAACLDPGKLYSMTLELLLELVGGGSVMERRTDYRFESKEGDRFVLVATGEDGKTQRLECEFDGGTLIVTMDGQAVAFKRANR